MGTTILVEINLTCDLVAEHGGEAWVHLPLDSRHFEHPSSYFGGSADYQGLSRGEVKRAARKAGWKLATRRNPLTLCPTHNKRSTRHA